MPRPRNRQNATQNQENESEGEEMTTETETSEETQPVVVEYPRTIGDKVFQTPQELEEYSKQLNDLNKEVKAIVKASKPGRPVSQKKVISTAVADFLNEDMSDDLRLALMKIEGDFILRLNIKDGVFAMPVAATRAEGSGGNRGGRKVNVDGTEYPSAKNARDTLHPDMKDKQQNFKTIVKYLEGKEHTVTEVTSEPTE